MKLNQNQKKAIQNIDGPVMVIAGPGTGKTEIIAHRIGNILKKTDTPPDAILAITFTQSGAKEMLQRLLTTIGQTAYYLNIYTFHAFCSSVIQEFPDHFTISPQLEPLSDLERTKIFQQILKNHHFKILKPVNQPFFYTQSLIKAIQDLKREAITPSIFKSILKKQTPSTLQQKKNHQKNLELVNIYTLYQKSLKNLHRYDFEDMINLVVTAFKNDSQLLLTYQERLHYFLVDEYQDTNSAQNQVIDLLASYWGPQANLFVVGDPNQSIYRFQGASLENTLSFTQTYPQATVISLNKNYRSNQTILDAGYHLIQKNHLKIEKHFPFLNTQLIAQTKNPRTPIKILSLPSSSLETYAIAQNIKKLIKKGVNPQEIAVIYRHNADAHHLTDILAKLQIPYDIQGGSDILKDPTLQQLITLLKVINSMPENLEDLDLFTLFHFQFFDLPPLDILKIARFASQKQKSFLDVIISDDFQKLKLQKPQKFKKLVKQLITWQQLDAQLTFPRFFETILNQSGFLDWIMTLPDSVAVLNRLNSLFSQIKKLSLSNHRLNLKEFLDSLELMELNYLKLKEEDLDIKLNSVNLTTAHQAKGKEWDYVFIYQCIDTKWGNHPSRELIKLPESILTHSNLQKKEKNEDERRLFYVSLTRAKKQIFLSFADRYTSFGQIKEAVPSMFISQIPSKFKTTVSTKTIQKNAPQILKTILTKPSSPKVSLKEKQFLTKVLKDFKLSPTALNTYLACPYKFKLNSLLKIPRAKAPYLSFGTAVHRALELFYRRFTKTSRLPSQKYLLTQFQTALQNEVLTLSDYQSRLKHGHSVLSAYYSYYQKQFQKPLFTEKYFGSGWSKTIFDGFPLSGKVDRIDLINQKQKTVKVVDYKTGAPKSKNHILGKTKSSSGDYYRQLVFYQLLSILDKNFPLKVVEAQIDFIEPQPNKKFVKQVFKIPSPDINDLKNTLKKVIRELKTLQFNRTTELNNCQRCEYQKHCWPKGLPQTK